LVPEQKFVVKRLCLMQEEAESTFLKRYRLEGKSLAVITGGSTGEMLKKALQEESISFEAIETQEVGKRELQLMTQRILSFVLFPSPPLQSLKK
jgi:uroporphyrinogen-III synthase